MRTSNVTLTKYKDSKRPLKKYADGGAVLGSESSLSSWGAPYVTDMLSKGQALSNMPYDAYEGPLTAGPSELQNKAFSGVASLSMPTDKMGTFTPRSWADAGTQQKFMNPYVKGVLDPAMEEARRQSEISRVQNAGRLTKAGAYGGSRQAVMESEGIASLERNLANIYGTGMNRAYETGMGQFNTEQGIGLAAQNQNNQYGFDTMSGIADLGAVQRGIESEGVAADLKQFEQERDDPYKKVQYQQSMLQGLPLQTNSYSYAQPSTLSNFMGGAGGILELLEGLFSGDDEAAGAGAN